MRYLITTRFFSVISVWSISYSENREVCVWKNSYQFLILEIVKFVFGKIHINFSYLRSYILVGKMDMAARVGDDSLVSTILACQHHRVFC